MFDTPIKKKAREMELKFAKKAFPKLVNPADARVFCFPYTSADQALEVTDVFDELEVPRWNITGFERIGDRYQSLAGQKLGIDLVLGEAKDYFKTTTHSFDFISLDFQGQMSDEVIDILRSIAGGQILSSKGILLVNVYGKREGFDVKTHYSLADENPFEDEQFSSWIEASHPEISGFNPLDVFKDSKLMQLYKEFRRDIGITRLITGIMYKGADNLYIPKLFRVNPRFGAINDSYRSETVETFRSEVARRGSDYVSELRRKSLEGNLFLMDKHGEKHYLKPDQKGLKVTDAAFVGELEGSFKKDELVVLDADRFYQAHLLDIARQMELQGLEPTKHLEAIMLHRSGRYFLGESARYRYTTPASYMFMDMLYFDQAADVVGTYKDINVVDVEGGHLKFSIPERLGKDSRELNETLEYFGYLRKVTSFPIPYPRIALK